MAAIFGGNILYFLFEASLPTALRHQRFQVDAGLALDFAFCEAVYGLIRLAARWGRVVR